MSRAAPCWPLRPTFPLLSRDAGHQLTPFAQPGLAGASVVVQLQAHACREGTRCDTGTSAQLPCWCRWCRRRRVPAATNRQKQQQPRWCDKLLWAAHNTLPAGRPCPPLIIVDLIVAKGDVVLVYCTCHGSGVGGGGDCQAAACTANARVSVKPQLAGSVRLHGRHTPHAEHAGGRRAQHSAQPVAAWSQHLRSPPGHSAPLHAPVYHFWMRIFSGRVPARMNTAAAVELQSDGRLGSAQQLSRRESSSAAYTPPAQPQSMVAELQREPRQLPSLLGRLPSPATAPLHPPVCAATIFFRSPIVSSSLHLTRICGGVCRRQGRWGVGRQLLLLGRLLRAVVSSAPHAEAAAIAASTQMTREGTSLFPRAFLPRRSFSTTSIMACAPPGAARPHSSDKSRVRYLQSRQGWTQLEAGHTGGGGGGSGGASLHLAAAAAVRSGVCQEATMLIAHSCSPTAHTHEAAGRR